MAKKSVHDFPHLAAKFAPGQSKPGWASSHTPENGKVHWDIGLPGALCGNHEKSRKNTTFREKVTCPECKTVMRSRP